MAFVAKTKCSGRVTDRWCVIYSQLKIIKAIVFGCLIYVIVCIVTHSICNQRNQRGFVGNSSFVWNVPPGAFAIQML